MPNWKIKAFIQGTLSRLPNAQRWNRLMQKHITHSLEISDDYFASKWRQAARHADYYRQHAGSQDSFTALELGTGWFPINPVGLALSGASTVFTIDRERLLQRDQVMEVLKRFHALIKSGEIEPAGKGACERLEKTLEAARDESLSASAILKTLGVISIVGDARSTSLQADAIDLVCSNNTLEHIPGGVIEAIFREFHRVLKPEGLMSHHIDLSDHYSHFDRSLTVYNFLRYSDREWQRYNNDLQYQNRLRLSDYRALHETSGWRVLAEKNLRKPLEELRSVPVAEQYRDFEESDLAVHSSWMLSVNH